MFSFRSRVKASIKRKEYGVKTINDYYREKKRIDELENRIDFYSLAGTELAEHEKNLSYLRTIGDLVPRKSWLEEKRKEKQELENAIFGDSQDASFYERFRPEIDYLRSCQEIKVFPYAFMDKSQEFKQNLAVYEQDNLRYVIHNNKKLFFPKMDDDSLKETYVQLIMEQNDNSPHKYFSETVKFENGIFVDVGSAEGIISLDVIEKAKEIYLFESSEEWVNALRKTFADYKDKIHVIQKYAGRVDGDETISLNTVLSKYENEDIFIKMDVEGMELEVLCGCTNVMQNNNCKFACASYHTQSMEEKLKKFFDNYNYKTETSDGYMLFIYGALTMKNGMYEKMEFPYFRKGLVRAYK